MTDDDSASADLAVFQERQADQATHTLISFFGVIVTVCFFLHLRQSDFTRRPFEVVKIARPSLLARAGILDADEFLTAKRCC
jgi:hypothetical protein